MYVLFDDVVATQPLPVYPVADVPFHVGPSFFTLAIPQHALVPVNVAAGDFADEACLNLLVGLHVATLVMTLCAHYNAQALCLCLLGCCHDRTVTLGVDGDRLLEERVDTLLGCILEVVGAEYWRSSADDHVNTRVDNLLVGVETDEAVLLWHFLTTFVDEAVANIVQTILKYIAKSNNLDIVGCIEQVDDGTATASATTNETNLQFWTIDGLVGEFWYIVFALFLERSEFLFARTTGKKCRGCYCSGSNSCSTSQKVASADSFFFHRCVVFIGLISLCLVSYFVGTSHTTRKPMPFMSLSHQMLLGFCGSVLSQAS